MDWRHVTYGLTLWSMLVRFTRINSPLEANAVKYWAKLLSLIDHRNATIELWRPFFDVSDKRNWHFYFRGNLLISVDLYIVRTKPINKKRT